MSAMKEAFRKAVEEGDKRSYNEYAADMELAKWKLRMAIQKKKVELNQVTTTEDGQSTDTSNVGEDDQRVSESESR